MGNFHLNSTVLEVDRGPPMTGVRVGDASQHPSSLSRPCLPFPPPLLAQGSWLPEMHSQEKINLSTGRSSYSGILKKNNTSIKNVTHAYCAYTDSRWRERVTVCRGLVDLEMTQDGQVKFSNSV